MKYRKKPVVIEAITFDELVLYGRHAGGKVVNGMPWEFGYSGRLVVRENDDCYLIPTLEGLMKMGRNDMLITEVNGEIHPCRKSIFNKTYDPA